MERQYFCDVFSGVRGDVALLYIATQISNEYKGHHGRYFFFFLMIRRPPRSPLFPSPTLSRSAGATGGVIVPFQVALQVHMTVGPDRTRDRLRAAFGGRRGGGGGEGGRGGLPGAEGGGPQDFAARLGRILPNPISAMLELRDSLALSPDQVAGLQAIADSLDAQNRPVSDSLRAAVQRAGERPDPGTLFARLRPKLAEGREHIRRALERARSVLTADQWAKLPDTLKTAGGRGARGR